MILSGGVSIGRERVNTCNLVNDLSLTQTGNGRTQDPRTDGSATSRRRGRRW